MLRVTGVSVKPGATGVDGDAAATEQSARAASRGPSDLRLGHQKAPAFIRL
jgi:hypothetical protein